MRRLLSSVLVLYLGVSLSLCFTPPRSSCGSIITGIWQHGQPPHFSRHQVSSRALGMPLRSSPEVSDEPVGPFSPTYVASFRRLTSLKWISRTLDWIKSSRGAKEGKQITVDVAVVGAGIAGLICARELYRKGFDVLLLEASGAPLFSLPEREKERNALLPFLFALFKGLMLFATPADGVGGRIRTDIVKGFLLDRGFQVCGSILLKRNGGWFNGTEGCAFFLARFSLKRTPRRGASWTTGLLIYRNSGPALSCMWMEN
jgi:hypothetical protein